ncbi:hemolysin III family protein [endosymbiont 'TC1' of Trimyema compressum]|uniref:hemolysin III family protein n=1 Tax=endosymbiont 'TC1' of Trimyema compressum TaxID=243899 RepID=UPI003CCB9DBA
MQPLIANIPLGGIILLATGGLFYTLGLVFYLIKSKKYFYSIWHIFVLLGSVCHILAVILYVLL